MKRLIRKSEFAGNKLYGYHATGRENLESIQQNGFQTSADGYVYFAPTKNVALTHVQSFEETVIFKVAFDEGDISEIKENNDALRFYDVALEYFMENLYHGEEYQMDIAPELELSENPTAEEFEDFWLEVEEEFPEIYRDWDARFLQAYCDTEADLMVSYVVTPDKIVEVIDK